MIDVSHEMYQMQIAVCQMAWGIQDVWTAPSLLYKPVLKKDGSQWCALYGDNLQEGIAGFGDTPSKAMESFDKAWRGKL